MSPEQTPKCTPPELVLLVQLHVLLALWLAAYPTASLCVVTSEQGINETERNETKPPASVSLRFVLGACPGPFTRFNLVRYNSLLGFGFEVAWAWAWV